MVQTTPRRVRSYGVDFQHPNRVDGSSSGNRPLEGSGKTLQVYFQLELGKNHLSLYYSSCAASDKRYQVRGRARIETVNYGRFRSKRLRPPMQHARIRSEPSPRLRPSLHPFLAPSHPPCLPCSLPEVPPS